MMDGLSSSKIIEMLMKLLRRQSVVFSQKLSQLGDRRLGLGAGSIQLNPIAGRQDYPLSNRRQFVHALQRLSHGGGRKGDFFPNFNRGRILTLTLDNDIHLFFNGTPTTEIYTY